MQAIEKVILDFIQGVYTAIGWPGVLALMALESALIPIPSEVIMPFAAWFLIADKGLGVEWVFLLAFVGAAGNLLGSLIAYWLGAVGGRPLLERYGRFILISQHDIDRADRWFARHGEGTVFFSRLMPVVRTFISLPAGIAKMGPMRFSIFTLLGAYPFCLALAFGGYKLGEHWERVREVMRPFDIPIIIVLVVLVAWYIWRHVKASRAAPQHGASGSEG